MEYNMGKTEEFIIKAKGIHGDKYDYTKAVYLTSKTKMTIICSTHGEFQQRPSHHLEGKHCQKCSHIAKTISRSLTTEQFIIKSKLAHKDKYDYSKVNYVNKRTNVTIICPEHGEFQQLPYMHWSGSNCMECSRILSAKVQTKTTEEFISEAKLVHGNKYDYSKVEYTGALNSLTITCPIHGEFEQRASDHLSGCGCPKCSLQLQGWSHAKWEIKGLNSNHFTGFKVYILECKDRKEHFIKIGKTFTSISKRYPKTAIPYEWKVIKEYTGTAKEISELEHSLHNKYREQKYKPLITFRGITECFNISILPNII